MEIFSDEETVDVDDFFLEKLSMLPTELLRFDSRLRVPSSSSSLLEADLKPRVSSTLLRFTGGAAAGAAAGGMPAGGAVRVDMSGGAGILA